MPTPEFIDGGLKLLQAATRAARDGDERALAHAEALATLFRVPDGTIGLMGAIIEGHEIADEAMEAGLRPLALHEDAAPARAGGLARAGVEDLLGKTRKSIRGGALLPRIASGKVSLAPAVRRTVMYHANEEHRGGAREVVKLYKAAVTLNEHADALLFAAAQHD